MTRTTFLDGRVTLLAGDCREQIKTIPDNSIDSCCCDPPYALVSVAKRFANSPRSENTENTENPYGRTGRGFMGQRWDTGESAFAVDFWSQVYRVLKPGGYVLAFGGTRTYHRLACAIEDAGFEIRDQIDWLYGSGFPKSLDLAKAIDKAQGTVGERVPAGAPVKRMIPGADQNKDGWEKTNGREYQPGSYVPGSPEAEQWNGWGTALKPSLEPICMARKPIEGTNAENVLRYGTGALNIDGCRIPGAKPDTTRGASNKASSMVGTLGAQGRIIDDGRGRWPANVIHDGSDEVIDAFPNSEGGHWSGETPSLSGKQRAAGPESFDLGKGSAARFFFSPKADGHDRLGSKHPTVKPLDLMQYLVRLVTPPGGLVLDPFAGTGTTGEAAWREGMNAILIEREAEYQADIARRMDLALHPTKRAAVAKSKNKLQGAEGTPLFGDAV